MKVSLRESIKEKLNEIIKEKSINFEVWVDHQNLVKN
jgi:hypothetical protein